MVKLKIFIVKRAKVLVFFMLFFRLNDGKKGLSRQTELNEKMAYSDKTRSFFSKNIEKVPHFL